MLLAAQFAFGVGCEQLRMVLLSAAHFKAAVRPGGLLSGAHFLSGSSGCAPAYLSSALHGPVGKVRTFSSGPADAPVRAGLLLSTAQILAQFSAQGCYSQHNLTQPWARAARQCGLLSAAQFNRRPTAVTVHSITAGLFALYCYSAHISLPFAPTQPTLYRAFMKTDF